MSLSAISLQIAEVKGALWYEHMLQICCQPQHLHLATLSTSGTMNSFYMVTSHPNDEPELHTCNLDLAEQQTYISGSTAR